MGNHVWMEGADPTHVSVLEGVSVVLVGSLAGSLRKQDKSDRGWCQEKVVLVNDMYSIP